MGLIEAQHTAVDAHIEVMTAWMRGYHTGETGTARLPRRAGNPAELRFPSLRERPRALKRTAGSEAFLSVVVFSFAVIDLEIEDGLYNVDFSPDIAVLLP
ncbi:hypothetical protein HS048_20595 [Planomonospora sp. ID91781]|uniref:hypothetical protein n=1 Tax=Planomonospora sp. ID91781 TaxID=2738135 RepID=UPI0018C385E5|nr:hypothetical protein [Planomonospora sp. ID91781]MBG0823138.1 hypothetical protein [Planomonospora sp. ID91781]